MCSFQIKFCLIGTVPSLQMGAHLDVYAVCDHSHPNGHSKPGIIRNLYVEIESFLPK